MHYLSCAILPVRFLFFFGFQMQSHTFFHKAYLEKWETIRSFYQTHWLNNRQEQEQYKLVGSGQILNGRLKSSIELSWQINAKLWEGQETLEENQIERMPSGIEELKTEFKVFLEN